jgi:hypothetical protein
VASFWCFSFERFNGILGGTPTNKRSVELQIMRRFVISRYFDEGTLPIQFQDEFLGLCSRSTTDISGNHTSHTEWSESYAFKKIACEYPVTDEIDWKNQSDITPPSSYRISHFDTDDMQMILRVYNIMYPSLGINIENLSETINKFGSIVIGSVCYGSRMEPRRIRSGYILASWPDGNGHVNTETFALSAGTINFFFSHSIKVGEQYHTHYFACVQWYKLAESSSNYGNPIKVWKLEFQDAGSSAFIPVQRIHSRFACAKVKNENGGYDVMAFLIVFQGHVTSSRS